MPERNRFLPPIPYDYLAEVPSFDLTSDDIADGQPIDLKFVATADFGPGGQNVSPHLRWSGFPEQTKSFAVTCFDPDAPTGSGFWHWVLFDIPANVTELASGAASEGLPGVPAGATCGRNDTGNEFYVGPFPPAGHGPHRYVFAVHAVDTDKLGIDGSVPPAVVGFNLSGHVVARAVLTATFEMPG